MIISHSFNSKRLLSIFLLLLYMSFLLPGEQCCDVLGFMPAESQAPQHLWSSEKNHFHGLSQDSTATCGHPERWMSVLVCHLSVWVSPFQLLCQTRSSNTFTSFSFNCLSNLSHLFQLSYWLFQYQCVYVCVCVCVRVHVCVCSQMFVLTVFLAL